MSIFKLHVATLIVLLTVSRNGLAQTRALELKWNELASMVVGHGVTLTLTDGTAVKGEAVAVRDDAMLVDVGLTPRPIKKAADRFPATPSNSSTCNEREAVGAGYWEPAYLPWADCRSAATALRRV